MAAAVLARRVALACAVAGSAVACTPAPPGTRPSTALVDTTFYVSSRARLAGRDLRRLADSLEYGIIVTVRKAKEDPLTDNELPFRLVDSVRFSRDEFVGALRARTEPGEFAVLYTHGFGTSQHEAWEQAVHGRLRSQGHQPWVVFSWPASDGWLSMPQKGAFLSASYRQDSASAVASRVAFLAAFGAVRESVGNDRIVIFTHSLGIQVAAEALRRDDAPQAALTALPLRGIAFYAADAEVTHFSEVLVPALRPMTQRLVLYASSDDRALGLAQRLSRTRRAGRISGKDGLPVLREGLESVDVTVGASAEGFFRRLFGARHGVRHASGALFDLAQLVGAGRAAECRETLGTADRIAPTAWRLRPAALPAVAEVTACPPFSR